MIGTRNRGRLKRTVPLRPERSAHLLSFDLSQYDGRSRPFVHGRFTLFIAISLRASRENSRKPHPISPRQKGLFGQMSHRALEVRHAGKTVRIAR